MSPGRDRCGSPLRAGAAGLRPGSGWALPSGGRQRARLRPRPSASPPTWAHLLSASPSASHGERGMPGDNPNTQELLAASGPSTSRPSVGGREPPEGGCGLGAVPRLPAWTDCNSRLPGRCGRCRSKGPRWSVLPAKARPQRSAGWPFTTTRYKTTRIRLPSNSSPHCGVWTKARGA